MRRLQVVFLSLLLLAPLAILFGVGVWAVWRAGWLFYVWWVLPVCWGLAAILQRRWRLFLIPMPSAVLEPPLHWTPRDEEAAKLIEARQKRVDQIDPEHLAEPQFYVETAREISLEIARHYRPNAADPWSAATMIEVLAAAQLALADMEDWASRYIPGSQVVSLKTWRTMAGARKWSNVAYNAYWTGSILLNPLNLSRYLASKFTIDPLTDHLQANVLALFHVFFVRQVGLYAIEMNSGRLRGGVAKYREAMARLQPAPLPPTVDAATGGETSSTPAPPSPGPSREALTVTIALVGQVKAGKSSLVNALLGERRAATDVLPATLHATEYQLALAGAADRLVLLDTAGYASDASGPRAWADSLDAVERSDLVLLVMKATSPARAADVQFVEAMDAWYRANPRRRPPKILGVVTHVDGLSPAMEWSPPYQWETPTSAKEDHIREAVAYAATTFAGRLAGVVPVCGDVDRGRAWGIDEGLVPAVTQLLDEARGSALLRTLHAELDEGRVRRVLEQVRVAGRRLIELCLPGAKP